MPELMDPSMPSGLNLVWLVLLLPLAGFLFQAAFGKAIERAFGKSTGRRILGFMAVLPIAAAFVIGCILVSHIANQPENARVAISTWFDWINLQSIHIPFELRVDPLSLTMVLIITGIGALIHLYATGYMADDKDYPRFFTYLNLFIAFMLMLVLGNNLALVFIGWEGVGLCSYLLIGFWYEDIENAKAANKAFIVNRIGDWGMALGMFLIAVVFASSQNLLGGETRYLSFDVILPLAQQVVGEWGGAVVWAIPLLLFIGAVGKSAQFPLYLWLPDAMAGPTPVSALIHAATMVTAGVYLVTRCHVFFEMSAFAMGTVAVIGCFTAIFAATIAWGQYDIKKVLAYSTVSQLGFMFLACGVGAFSTGMFHVTTHAFFKALLFLGAGAVIYAMAHNQDLRNYGGLRKYMKITYGSMLMGWLAICGIPIWAGFWSKDDILGKVFASNEYWHSQGWAINPVILWAIGLATAVLTAAYMTRMFWLTFFSGEERWRNLPEPAHVHHHAQHHEHDDHHDHGHDEHGFFIEHVDEHEDGHDHDHHDLGPSHEPNEVKPAMWFPLVVLAVLSTVGGLILSGGYPVTEVFGAHTTNLFKEWNAVSAQPTVLPAKEMFKVSHSTEAVLILLSIAAGLLGILWNRARYKKGIPQNEDTKLRRLAGSQWGYDNAMVKTFVDIGGKFSDAFYKIFDKGVIDTLFVNGIPWVVASTGKLIRKTQSGFVRAYAMAILIGALAIASYIFYSISR